MLSFRCNCIGHTGQEQKSTVSHGPLLYFKYCSSNYVVHGDVPSLVVVRVRYVLRTSRVETLFAFPRTTQLQRVRVLPVDRVSIACRPKHAHRIVLKTRTAVLVY